MKRFFSLFFLAALLVNCTAEAQKAETVTVEGFVGEKSTMVYLVNADSFREVIDSVAVKNGKFTTTLPAKDNCLVFLSANGGYQQFFCAEGEKVSVDAVNDVIEGTGLNAKWGKLNADMKTEGNEAKKLLVDFCKENKDNNLPVAAMIIHQELLQWDVVTEIMAACEGKAFLNNPYVGSFLMMAQSQQARAVGTPLKDIAIPDAKGKMHKLSDYVGKGKYVLVDFWASWCGPCCREMPNVVEAYKKYKSKGFEIVGISLDQKKEPWLAAVKRMNMTWPQLSDLQGWKCEAAALYGVQAIPSNVLFDKDGKIIATDLTGATLRNKLKEVFE